MRLETFQLGAGQTPLEIRPAATARRQPLRGGLSLTGQALLRRASDGQALLRRASDGQALLRRASDGQALLRRASDGQATLSFILLVSGVVLEVAVAGSFVTYFLNSAGFGERLSARALAAAQAGVGDATLQVVRNKEFVTAGTAAYSFAVGSDTASVLISRTTDSAAGTYLYAITVTGVAGTRERRLAARMAVNQTTGLAELQEVREQPVD